ncbi:Fpg/Nei family DNA glycosylase [Streptomyces sp. NPDC002851]
MPELPDVEGFREVLASCARGRRIERVEVMDADVLHGASARRLARELTGRRLAEPERHGKWLLVRTDGPTVLLHFGMTGLLLCCGADEPRHRHDRVVLTVDGHELRYRDQRKLRGLWLDDPDRVLSDQGPDAMDLGLADFRELLSARRGGLKSALMNQSLLAGLGNLTADEILWRARLRPSRAASGLTGEEVRRLHARLRSVLRSSVRVGQVPPRPSWLTGHRDDADPHCPRCDGRLRRDRIAGRTTVWCPACQR